MLMQGATTSREHRNRGRRGCALVLAVAERLSIALLPSVVSHGPVCPGGFADGGGADSELGRREIRAG